MSSSGVYGTKIGSLVSPSDVDIFYSYSPTRNSLDVLNTSFKRLDSSLLMQTSIDESNNTYQYDNVLDMNKIDEFYDEVVDKPRLLRIDHLSPVVRQYDFYHRNFYNVNA